MESIPVGVVGVGHLGQHHARLYAAMPGVTLAGVADSDEARAREIAARHGCPAYASAQELAGKVRAASIAVPTIHHWEVARTLLEAGADVLVEKPIAATLGEAEFLVALARQTGRILMVGHVERFNPAILALAAAVKRPRFLEIHRLAGFSDRSTDIDVVLDLMIHDLDLVLYLDGTEALQVDAVGVKALTPNVDIANARIRFASGCVANVTASRISADRVRKIRVFQENTYLACDAVGRAVERYELVKGQSTRPEIRRDDLIVSDGEPLALELAAFVDSARTRRPPPVTGDEAIRALRLAFEVRDAIAHADG